MMRRRAERREERREERHEQTHYRMRQNLISFGDDYWIENNHGQRVFRVDGKMLRVRQTLNFEDAHGRQLCRIQERMARVRDSMEIEDADGKRIAMVHKAMITPVRERWAVDVANGPDLEVQGNILDHEYHINAGRDQVAEISKRWFRIADTYGVEIAPDQNDILILAITVAVDAMAHGGH